MIHFLALFRSLLYHRGYVEYHTPYRGAPETSSVITPIGGYHSPTACTGMLNTSMVATATPGQIGPNEFAACCRDSSDDLVVGCFRDQPTYVTGIGSTVATFLVFLPRPKPRLPLTTPVVASWPVTKLVACRCTGISKTNQFAMLRCMMVVGVG